MNRIAVFIVAFVAVCMSAETIDAGCGGGGGGAGLFSRFRARRAARQEARAQTVVSSYGVIRGAYATPYGLISTTYYGAEGCQCPGCPGNVANAATADAPPMAIPASPVSPAPQAQILAPATLSQAKISADTGPGLTFYNAKTRQWVTVYNSISMDGSHSVVNGHLIGPAAAYQRAGTVDCSSGTCVYRR